MTTFLPDILTPEALDTLTQADIAEAILAQEKYNFKDEYELAWHLDKTLGYGYPYCSQIAEKAFERMARNGNE